jgi:hypothetical protein
MSRFTKELRQDIVKDFVTRNGSWDAAKFFDEVAATGDSHPAYGWFEWDQGEAARQHNIWQARCFVQGLKIVFEVVTVGHQGPIRLRQEAPLLVSAIANRQHGGGYGMHDPDNQDDVAELSRQAASALRSWLKRFGSCLSHTDNPVGYLEQIEHIADVLDVARAVDTNS